MGDLQPLIGNPYNGYINSYYGVDDHPLLYGNNGSLDPGTCIFRPLKKGATHVTPCITIVFGVHLVDIQIFTDTCVARGCLGYLVGAQPPPCCSFARHLVGKMAI